MTIKLKLLNSTLFCFAIFVMAGIFHYYSEKKISEIDQLRQSSHESFVALFEMNVVTSDYLLHFEKQSYEQWKLRYASLGKLLEAMEPFNQESQQLVDRVTRKYQQLFPLFHSMAENHEAKIEDNQKPLDALKYRLSGQLSSNLQYITADIEQLTTLIYEHQMKSMAKHRTVTFIFITIMAVFIAGAAFLIYRMIVPPLIALEKGVKAIGDGRLTDLQVDINRSDEIGSLAVSFNKMADKLKKSLDSLRVEKELSQNYLDVAAVMIVTIDLNSRVTMINRKGCDILGYAEDEIIGKEWFENFLPARERDEVKKVYSQLIAGESRASEYYETPVLTKTGEERIIAWHNNYVKNDAGEIIGIIGSGEDITERKQVEEEKYELESRLIQAQKMEAIGTLAGGIAHDFNNILGAILGYTDMAMDNVPKESIAHRDLERVLTASYRAKDLVKQILAFSRQEKPELMLLQPAPIIKDALELLRASIPTTIDINESIDPQCGVILADPIQLNQIIMNLCTNAFHSMEESGGTLDVIFEKVELSESEKVGFENIPPGKYLKLTVRDTGQGINPTIRGRVFDPYFTTKEFGKGTGMGLPIVHGIVKHLEGFITLESEPGQGTSFYVFFSLAETEILEHHEEMVPVPEGQGHILFVDDEEYLVEVETDMLERLGYTVTARTSSIDALETFRAQPDLFDLVITDQTMPEMTGGEMAMEMMSIRPNIPIILCTGYSSQVSEEKAKAWGVREFAFKPIVKDDLAKLIRKVLDAQ